MTAASNSAAVNQPGPPSSVSWTPAFAPLPPVSCQTAWASRETITSSPGRVSDRRTTWLAIVPVGSQSAASLPSRSAIRSWRRLTVGSSPNWSSPTSAAAIAARIPADGRVTVSERRSIGVGDITAIVARSGGAPLGRAAAIEPLVRGYLQPGPWYRLTFASKSTNFNWYVEMHVPSGPS